MAGHSQFKNIMYRKGAQDAKRAKLFTKLIRELTVAARSNPDPEANPRLRAAIANARVANMPKDTMDRAIKRGSGGDDTAHYEELRYEGYGPGGVAIIAEALTDNRNRTASDVRAAFNKFNGNLGEIGSVSFSFRHVATFEYPLAIKPFEEVFEIVIEAGADNMETLDDRYEIITDIQSMQEVRDTLIAKLGEPTSIKLIWQPTNLIRVTEEIVLPLLKLIETLEDNDDIQQVFSNADIPDELMEKLNI